jgi:hypothetical protein
LTPAGLFFGLSINLRKIKIRTSWRRKAHLYAAGMRLGLTLVRTSDLGFRA